jgi:S-formylglutathione hydrolase FrmB
MHGELAASEFARLSVIDGWLPVAVQAVAATALLLVLLRPSRRWWQIVVPITVLIAGTVVAVAKWLTRSRGWADEPGPVVVWAWIGLTAVALALAVLGWKSAAWWRRAVSLLAVPLTALCTVLSLNIWFGYVRTVDTAWHFVTRGPLPDQTTGDSVAAAAAEQKVPAHGAVLKVDTGRLGSHFHHRGEIVYLPPIWFSTSPPPRMPVVMMIGGEFGSSADWILAGDAVRTIDQFAADHNGSAPVFVFVDKGGVINRDTECVNGPRGNAADHLTNDVVPFTVDTFGVSSNPDNWGIVGWSAGGTCALDLAVTHPELFSVFVDIAGDAGPNAGTKDETIDRLYGGDESAWAEFDPATAITRHGPYLKTSGLFAVSSGSPPDSHAVAADKLCRLGEANGIECSIVAQGGKHDWEFATAVFKSTLPWLAGRLGVPGVPPIPMPDDRPR